MCVGQYFLALCNFSHLNELGQILKNRVNLLPISQEGRKYFRNGAKGEKWILNTLLLLNINFKPMPDIKILN